MNCYLTEENNDICWRTLHFEMNKAIVYFLNLNDIIINNRYLIAV